MEKIEKMKEMDEFEAGVYKPVEDITKAIKEKIEVVNPVNCGNKLEIYLDYDPMILNCLVRDGIIKVIWERIETTPFTKLVIRSLFNDILSFFKKPKALC